MTFKLIVWQHKWLHLFFSLQPWGPWRETDMIHPIPNPFSLSSRCSKTHPPSLLSFHWHLPILLLYSRTGREPIPPLSLSLSRIHSRYSVDTPLSFFLYKSDIWLLYRSLSDEPMAPAIVTPSSRVLYYSLLSRVILLSLVATWRLLFRPYDTSASLNPPCLSSSSNQSLPYHQIRWPRLASAIETSVVWDGVYFVRIAECGYEYEQTYAFLPLLPLAMSIVSRSGEWSFFYFFVSCTLSVNM